MFFQYSKEIGMFVVIDQQLKRKEVQLIELIYKSWLKFYYNIWLDKRLEIYLKRKLFFFRSCGCGGNVLNNIVLMFKRINLGNFFLDFVDMK